ncbi:VanZ family protein [Methylobacterium sp. A54F]
MQRILRLSAWSVAAGLVLVTLAPIGWRPVVAGATVERAAAYALLGLLLALAYPRRWRLAVALVVAYAGVLELGQMLTETRHARLSDFLVKAGAAVVGALLAVALTRRRATTANAAGSGTRS